MHIHTIPRILRPREKMQRYGIQQLNNDELLALILSSGNRHDNAIQLAHIILKRFSIDQLAHLKLPDLESIPGIGIAKACQIMACFELGKRFITHKKTVLIMKPKDVWNELSEIRSKKKEYFCLFYLDIKNQMIKKEIISIGILNASLIHPREVFEPAIRNYTAQIIISHNHPSEDPQPSPEDIAITKNLAKAGKILGIEILDHIIVTSTRWYSFKEHGLM
jgi:DNA repair protein RadC